MATLKAQVTSKVEQFKTGSPQGARDLCGKLESAVEKYFNRGGTAFEDAANQAKKRLVIECFMQGLIIERKTELPALSRAYPTGYFDVREVMADVAVIKSILSTSVGAFVAAYVIEADELGSVTYLSNPYITTWAMQLTQALNNQTASVEAISKFCKGHYKPWAPQLLSWSVGRVRQKYCDDITPIRAEVYEKRGWSELESDYGLTLEELEVVKWKR